MIPLVIGLILMSSGCSNIQSIEPEHHLIPEGYTGEVTIVFDVADGNPQRKTENTRIYEIPREGKLLSQFSPNLGIRPLQSMHFFYINRQGVLTPIPSRQDKEKYVQNSPQTIVVSNVYIFNREMHYFIDRLDRIDSYKNPAISDDERK
jgi:hypothetical protein